MKAQFINFNGSIYPVGYPVMGIDNRGFRYGDGLFESMRLINGEIKFLSLHIDRLHRGMKALKLEGHSYIDDYFLNEKVQELVKRNKSGGNGRVRLTIFRDSGGLYSPESNQTGYAIELTNVEESTYIIHPKGLIADVFEDVRKPVNSLSNFKTCNSLVYVMAGIFKNQNSLDEAFILNQNGFLCEAISSNVFIIYDKKVYTPALSEGCIAGVMRSVVMRLAEENNIQVVEAQINPAVLREADEIFLTNASRGIQWVMGYNKKRYFNETSKFLIEKLNTSSSRLSAFSANTRNTIP